jgi:hypothetical protein
MIQVMYSARKKLAVTQEGLAVIEAALHTQIKILSVQAGAGSSSSSSRRKLSEVQSVLCQISALKTGDDARRRSSPFGWFGRRASN